MAPSCFMFLMATAELSTGLGPTDVKHLIDLDAPPLIWTVEDPS